MTKTRELVRREPRRGLLTTEISLQSLFFLFNTSDPNFIAGSLLKRKSEFEQLTKSDLSSEDLINLLKMLVNVYNLKNGKVRSQLLAITHSEEFVNNIKSFLQKNKNGECLKEVIDLVMYYVDANINELPISDVHYSRFYSLLKCLFDCLPDGQYNDIYLWTHEACLILQKKTIHKERRKYTWKELNVYPNPVDFFENKEIMPNKINGAYKNTEEYLDTVFKLLKEDYESRLRDGIMQMKAELRGAKISEKEIYVYNDINIERVEADKHPMNNIIHKIAFSVGGNEHFLNINKTFKYGSLLLLSRYSQFTNFLLATVVEDVELQVTENDTYKVLKVSFVGDISQVKLYWKYSMIESNMLFKPYYEVLTAIQTKSIENFPMEKYIVYLDNTPCFPKYISTDTEYKMDGKSVKLFGKVPWSENLLNLDTSQVEALQSTFTHEFVLIQGPPGSGKTHLARTIIDVLIENKTILSTPILLISSDNYPVDFILEYLVSKERKVLRLGNQTKSAVLKKCLLHNMVKPCGRDKKLKIERMKESLLRKINQNEGNVENIFEHLQREQSLYRDFRDEDYARQVLSAKVDVIGGTTAGCARLYRFLEKVRPEVVIVENANEVLEGHMIPALSEGCKHLILIGDHKQLKPTISNKNLENYDLDVSLFERMMRCGVKCCTLKEQHRMRPEISSLLAPTFYQTINNHPLVQNIPKVRGVGRNLFFIDHEVAENQKKNEERSYSNRHEGDFLLALANYLVLQGYSLRELTILVPYAEQLKYMSAAARSYPLLNGVEILTMDTYSGHENTIVLLSLVRSHSNGIGFLSSSNKVVVSLSRARSGLYMIGNMKTLVAGSDIWKSLNTVLKKKQAIGRSIHLECKTHKKITTVSKKQDFKLSERGGCDLQCNLPLDCGHLCQLKCHPLLEEHATLICKECGQHKEEEVEIILPCGHTANMKYFASKDEAAAYICSKPCLRSCKQNIHQCKKRCYEECGPCNEDVDAMLPCGHLSKIKCYACTEENTNYKCNEPCSRICVKNLHKCKKKCYEECGQCNEEVDVILPCGHPSKKKCTANEEEKEICMKPTIVSYLWCLRKVVPCWKSDYCFYRKIEY